MYDVRMFTLKVTSCNSPFFVIIRSMTIRRVSDLKQVTPAY